MSMAAEAVTKLGRTPPPHPDTGTTGRLSTLYRQILRSACPHRFCVPRVPTDFAISMEEDRNCLHRFSSAGTDSVSGAHEADRVR